VDANGTLFTRLNNKGWIPGPQFDWISPGQVAVNITADIGGITAVTSNVSGDSGICNASWS